MIHKIILILNKDEQRVCEQYCYKELDLEKSIIEPGSELFICYKIGTHFTHEIVEKIEKFKKYGFKVTTMRKVWYIYIN